MEINLPSHPVTADQLIAYLMGGYITKGRKVSLIMRGAPGSGKSTIVSKLKAALPPSGRVDVASADAHRMVDGKYVFDASQNDEVHGRCLIDFVDAASAGMDRMASAIVCDNTNVNLQEVAPYYAIAKAYRWNPLVVNVQCPMMIAAARNQHGVPESHVCRMADRIARFKLPGNYRQVTVENLP